MYGRMIEDELTDHSHTHDSHTLFPTFPLLQREIALLVVLCAIAVALFLMTRSLAAWTRGITAQTAATWYARGQQSVRDGNITEAITDYRRAVGADRSSVRYQLALARTLSDAGLGSEAEQLLVRLRDVNPDDVEINYRLARLASAKGLTADAVRYYNDALYGIDHGGAPVERYRIRTELVAFLLDRGDRDSAEAELGPLVRELPDEAGAHSEAARLADQAGDDSLALREFIRAAALDPKDPEAPAAAGQIAFQLGDFATTQEQLEAAQRRGSTDERVARTLAAARLAQRVDPLGPRVAMAERARRLQAGLIWAIGRLDACTATGPDASSTPDGLRAELVDLKQRPLQDSARLRCARLGRRPHRPHRGRRAKPLPRRRAGRRRVDGNRPRAPAGRAMKFVTSSNWRLRENQLFLALTVVIGIIAGLMAVLFALSIDAARHMFFGANPPWWRLMGIAVGVSAVTGVLLAKVFPDVRGSGVPQTKAAFHLDAGIIRPRVAFGKFLTGVLCIGSGHSMGREGPSVQIGGALASWAGQWLHMPPERIRNLVPVGASAALAAAFNTPVAAVLFSLEEIIADMNAPLLGSTVVASVAAVIVERSLLGNDPLFHVPQYQLVHPGELLAYPVLGIIGGVISVIFSKGLLATRQFFMDLPPWTRIWQPAMGGIAIGVVLIFLPQVTGVGYEYVDQALNGGLLIGMMVLLCAAKLVATIISYASGNAGGIFAPTLYLGAMAGGVVGLVAQQVAPFPVGAPGAYALVGMGTPVCRHHPRADDVGVHDLRDHAGLPDPRAADGRQHGQSVDLAAVPAGSRLPCAARAGRHPRADPRLARPRASPPPERGGRRHRLTSPPRRRRGGRGPRGFMLPRRTPITRKQWSGGRQWIGDMRETGWEYRYRYWRCR